MCARFIDDRSVFEKFFKTMRFHSWKLDICLNGDINITRASYYEVEWTNE